VQEFGNWQTQLDSIMPMDVNVYDFVLILI